MPLYYYKVGREDGSTITSEAEAESEDALRAELDASGYLVLELKKKRALGFDLVLPGVRKGLRAEDFLVFNQELLVLIRAGLPIVQSLDLLMERVPNEAFRKALADSKSEIRGGRALSDALAMHAEFFPELYCNSLRSGEKTGNLAEVLERYIAYLKRVLDAKRKLVGALTYPVLLVCVTTAVVIFLFTYVVPTFSEIYSDFKAELPTPTLILMNVTRFLKSYILVFAAAAAGLFFAGRAWYHTKGGRRLWDSYLLRLPMVGSLARAYYVSTISRTLSTVLSGGIPMLDALDMVAKSITNRDLTARLYQVQSRVREGMSLAEAFERFAIMSPMTIRMVEVGEATGALETMLDDISSFYEDEVNVRLQRLTSLVEPVIMLMMGLVVGTVVLVMYLPIFELAGTVK